MMHFHAWAAVAQAYAGKRAVCPHSTLHQGARLLCSLHTYKSKGRRPSIRLTLHNVQ